MEEKIKQIIMLRDQRLEESRKETNEKLKFAGFCVVTTLNEVLRILDAIPAEEEITDELMSELVKGMSR